MGFDSEAEEDEEEQVESESERQAQTTPSPPVSAPRAPAAATAAPAPASGSLAGGPSPSHRSAHIQRGALHLSKAEKEDRETSNVFRVIAQQLRAHRSLYGHAMATARDAFRLIDKDGSETLDHAELKEALHRLDVDMS